MTANDSTLPPPVIADEHIQLVDARNRPCGSAPRAMMRRFHFWHRATYIVVRNAKGDICVQRRTLTKEVFPGDDDLAAGGVVGAGEAVHQAARRELAEELGIRGQPLRSCGDFRYDKDGHHIYGSIYLVDYDGPLCLQPEEVASVRWMPLKEALALETATPDTHSALGMLYAGGWLEQAA
ncbi:NUDIX hydrolase [Onishia niordana]|uniref:NUDIX hydrolase n=1 Tax=Onishia niordana TaxID=2508711 RepID=UPI0010A0775B|nr:NUDIX domain-containing protein [Halomonas niordiana]